MRWAAAFLLMLVVACSQVSQPEAKRTSTPSPSATASPLAAASPPATSPSSAPVAGDLPLSSVTFSCRLPIATPDGQGAFIRFPSEAVTFDPNGQGLQGYGGAYYDLAYSRWLPVAREAVSPDGKHYAVGERGTEQTKLAKVHVVDVPSGVDHAFATPDTEWFVPYGVLDYASEGIYLTTAWESPRYGLWRMDPTTGTVTRIAQIDYIQGSAGNRILWLGSINPSDQHPIGGLYAFADQLDRYSLADGSRVTWLYRPGNAVIYRGMDVSGHPIAYVQSSFDNVDLEAELVLLLDPHNQRTILKAPARFLGELFQSIPDSHGVWFGSRQGIYLYSEAGGLQKVSNQPGFPANGCF